MSEAEHEVWWRRALIAGFAGLLFSLTLALVLSLGSALRIGPFVVLERAGVDFGQQTYVTFAPWLDPSFDGPPSHTYAFVDVDYKACRRFAPDGRACRVDRPVPAALIEDFARAAAMSGARVVIIDVAPPDEPAERERLRRALARPTGPYFIAPLHSRPDESGGQLALDYDRQGSLTPQLAEGRLRLAPIATATDAGAADGVIRHFPVLTELKEPGAPDRWIPSAPFLAAMLADPQTAAAMDCRFYPNVATQPCGAAPARLDKAIAFGRDLGLRNRILYTLPSLAAGKPGSDEMMRNRYLGRYDRYPASGFLGEGGFEIPEGVLSGRIVVLGSSVAQGHDWHATPLGAMTGSEVVINATRAFAEFSPLSDANVTASTGRRLFEGLGGAVSKLPGVIIGAGFMTLGWLLIFYVRDRLRGRPWLANGVGAGLFLVLMAGLFVVEILAGLSGLRATGHVPRAVDMLTPIVALGLEGYAEAARSFTDRAETLARRTLDVIERRLVPMLTRRKR